MQICLKGFFSLVLIILLAIQFFNACHAFAIYPCNDPYCPDTPPGYQYENFKLTYTPTICEVEPNDTRFPNLAKTLITTTHTGVENWLTQLNNGPENSIWTINEIIMPPSNQVNLDPACNVAIVYESQELDYCGAIYNGMYFPCGAIFNGITIPNPQTNTALVFIPYLMPVYNQQCRYEKNGITYDMICRSQTETENQTRLLKAVSHEIGHAMGLGHFIADSKYQAGRWIAGTEPVPSIMVSGQEGHIEYAQVTARDANIVRVIYGSNGFELNANDTENIQGQNSLRLQANPHLQPWMEDVIKWWSEGKINDTEFENFVKYLIHKEMIQVHVSGLTSYGTTQEIPLWIKNIASWGDYDQEKSVYFSSIIQWTIQNIIT